MQRCLLLIATTLLTGLSSAWAQDDTTHLRLMESSLEQLLTSTVKEAPKAGSQQTGIADLIDQDIRDAPGIIQVLTAAEMAAAGCRTLEDALMLVPSFSLGRDVDDVLGVSIRGQWAQEGKCLFMLNGMPLNEASFGIFALGLRTPVDHISRIEVINGPGSVVHGGFAALGVVNIVTSNTGEDESLKCALTGSFSGPHSTYSSADLSGHHRLTSETEIEYDVSLATGHRFASSGTMANGTSISYQDSSGSQTNNLYFRVMHKGFQGQFFMNDHHLQVSDQPYDVLMRTITAEAAERLSLGGAIQFELKGLFRTQLPWSYSGEVTPELYRTNTIDHRIGIGVTFTYKPARSIQLSWGLNSYLDMFRLMDRHEGTVLNINGKPKFHLFDVAAFAEARIHSKLGSVLAGIRAERHDLGGSLAAPRFAYTWRKDHLHVKAMHSIAFKMPTMQNVNTGPEVGDMLPEVVSTQEMEIGWSTKQGLITSIVAFRTKINDPIVYVLQQDSAVTDSYLNRTSSASEGIEARLVYTQGKAAINASFSTYRSDPTRTDLPETAAPDDRNRGFLGLPQSKATFVARYQLGENTRLGSSVVWSSDSWSYQYTDTEQSVASFIRTPAWTRLGFTMSHAFNRVKGLEATLRADNVLDDRWNIHSPYNNGLSSLPMPGREFTVKLIYCFPL
jgi:outer membrane receptor for ferrienterochelin and colicin